MNQDAKTDLTRFFWFLLAHVLVLLLTFIIWRYLWLKRTGVEVPIDDSQETRNNKPSTEYQTTKNFNVFWRMFYDYYTKFNQDYWVRNWGLDAYLYLLFQRKVLKLLFTISCISLVLSFFFNFISDHSLQIQDPKWRNDWTVKILFGSKDLVKGTWSWVQVSLCIFITIATLKIIFSLKTKGREMYKKYSRSGEFQHDYEWLRSRTIHVRGLLKNDITGAFLENMLNEHLHDTESKILSILVVPDFK